MQGKPSVALYQMVSSSSVNYLKALAPGNIDQHKASGQNHAHAVAKYKGRSSDCLPIHLLTCWRKDSWTFSHGILHVPAQFLLVDGFALIFKMGCPARLCPSIPDFAQGFFFGSRYISLPFPFFEVVFILRLSIQNSPSQQSMRGRCETLTEL